jgi:hypothetical protein
MLVFFITLCFFIITITIMSIGAIFKNKPIQGSCGGMKALEMGTACEICGEKPTAESDCANSDVEKLYDNALD